MKRPRFHTSIFWRVVAVLVASQLVVAAIAITLTVRFAADSTRELALISIEARLDAVAEEIERRSSIQDGVLTMPDNLLADLAVRFPDPMAVVGPGGDIQHIIRPDPSVFEGLRVDSVGVPTFPDASVDRISFDALVVSASDEIVPGGYAVAPLYDAVGFPVGALIVQPLVRSVEWELMGASEAAMESLRLVSVLAILLALIVGALVTWWVVAPVRRIASRVADIGSGRYEARVEVTGTDEFGTLAVAVNRMAEDIGRNMHAMEQAGMLRRELVANVGHDLRTPLAAVQAYLEEAARFDEEGRVSDALQAVSGAHRQVLRVRRLVDDLFELSVLESGAPALRIEPVPLGEILEDALAALVAETPAGISVDLTPVTEWPMLQADGSRVLRLLLNVLTNAVRHARSGVRVDTMLTETGPHGRVRISISDDGPGMTPPEVERVFDRYYRGEDARTAGSGTGLGLAIARAIAMAHGGRIWMESTPGVGTTVHVELPLHGLTRLTLEG